MTVAVVFGGLVASVKADDIYNPPWQRGSAGTTWEGWTFTTGDLTSTPDEGYNNIYGTPSATINAGTSQWSYYYHNHIGVWTLGAGNNISLDIPNTPFSLTDDKYVWTQITWQSDNNGVPVVTVAGNLSILVSSQPQPNGWVTGLYETVLPYNPSSEGVVISGSLPGTTFDLGEVFIDTQCIPEPSSLALLAVGAGSLLVASRKRRLAA